MKLINEQAEANILGAMIVDKEAFHKGISLLNIDDFTQAKHQKIFQTMKELNTGDVVLLSDKLETKDMAVYIAKLMADYFMEDIGQYIKIIQEKTIARELIKEQAGIQQRVADTDDIFKILIDNKASIEKLLNKGKGEQTFNFVETIIGVMEKMETDKNRIPEFIFGFKKLDELINIERGNVVVIGGESSVGKTSLALNIAMNQNKRVLFCSMEMNKTEIIKRMFSMKAKINSTKIRVNNLDDKDWTGLKDTVKELQHKDIILEDIVDLQDVRKAIIKYKPAMVVIDHLQLLRAINPVGNRSQIVGEMANETKRIAEEENVAMILLSQLSRKSEEKKPTLNRLKESGDIENACDIAILLYWEWKETKDEEIRNVMELRIEKNRHGKIGWAKLFWQPEFYFFGDLKEDNNDKR